LFHKTEEKREDTEIDKILKNLNELAKGEFKLKKASSLYEEQIQNKYLKNNE